MHQQLSKVQRLIWSISLSSSTLIAYYLPWTFPNNTIPTLSYRPGELNLLKFTFLKLRDTALFMMAFYLTLSMVWSKRFVFFLSKVYYLESARPGVFHNIFMACIIKLLAVDSGYVSENSHVMQSLWVQFSDLWQNKENT